MNESKEFLYGDSTYLISLSKYIGKRVVDVVGYPLIEFEDVPIFKIIQLVFEDGTMVYVEGEHDVPYLPADDTLKNMDEKTLRCFSKE